MIRKAILLCAGFGTRLGELSNDRPKPLLPLCNIPIVAYGLTLLSKNGIEDVVINLHHQAEFVRESLGDGSRFNIRIHYTFENEILGTGGGIKNALSILDPDGHDEPFLSMNGKLIFDLNIPALLHEYNQAPTSAGMLVVRRVPNAIDWGPIDLDSSQNYHRVKAILEDRGDYMFCGVHLTRPSTMANLPDGECCSIRQGYIPWLKEGQIVSAYIANENSFFAENSTPYRYWQSNMDILQNKNALTFTPPGTTGISEQTDISPSAKILPPVAIANGVRIGDNTIIGPNTVLGANTNVGSNLQLSHCVVWANSQVTESMINGIITPQITIPIENGE